MTLLTHPVIQSAYKSSRWMVMANTIHDDDCLMMNTVTLIIKQQKHQSSRNCHWTVADILLIYRKLTSRLRHYLRHQTNGMLLTLFDDDVYLFEMIQ